MLTSGRWAKDVGDKRRQCRSDRGERWSGTPLHIHSISFYLLGGGTVRGVGNVVIAHRRPVTGVEREAGIKGKTETSAAAAEVNVRVGRDDEKRAAAAATAGDSVARLKVFQAFSILSIDDQSTSDTHDGHPIATPPRVSTQSQETAKKENPGRTDGQTG